MGTFFKFSILLRVTKYCGNCVVYHNLFRKINFSILNFEMKLCLSSLSTPQSPSSSKAAHVVPIGVPTVNLAHARFIFQGRIQENGESVQGYADELGCLASSCEYGSGVLEERIRDQLIFGLKSKAIQEKIIFDERLKNATLQDVISIASAGEAFQEWRFRNLNPLENDEIQTVLGPYLDENSLLAMNLVSQACANLTVKEWGTTKRRTRQRKPERNEVPFSERKDFEEFYGTIGLRFTCSREIVGFINFFVASRIEWPVTGQGIVQFCFDSDEFVENHERADIINDGVRDQFFKNVISFLQMFGAHVKVFIWKNDFDILPPGELKKMLSHTPLLRDLWLEGIAYEIENVEEEPWPVLAYLDSLHFIRPYPVNNWGMEPFLLAYGFQLTTLDISPLVLPSATMQRPVDQTCLSLLTNVVDFTVKSKVAYLRKIGEGMDWRLKKLSVTLSHDKGLCLEMSRDKFKDFDNYVHECELMLWSLINQSSSSLEEVYLDMDYWEDFVLIFLLPGVHPSQNSTQCTKVRRLVIRAMFSSRAEQLLEVLCKKFPSLKQIDFFYFGKTEFHGYQKQFQERIHKDVNFIPDWAKELFFKEDDPESLIRIAHLPREIFVNFWKDLHSLGMISVFSRSDDKFEDDVVNLIRT